MIVLAQPFLVRWSLPGAWEPLRAAGAEWTRRVVEDDVVITQASWRIRSDSLRETWHRRKNAGRLVDAAMGARALGVLRQADRGWPGARCRIAGRDVAMKQDAPERASTALPVIDLQGDRLRAPGLTG